MEAMKISHRWFLPLLMNIQRSKNMPKTPSIKLFHLIKSLTGSEKRYFKLFVKDTGGKTSKYIQLFEAIEKQETFDDEALRALVYPLENIQSRKYSELKAYLYELILKSLQSYDEKTSIEYKLQHILSSIKVLFKRALFEDCKELLTKGTKLAKKYEQFNALLKIMDWEKQIAYAETDIQYLDKYLSKIQAQETQALSQIENRAIYENIFYQLLIGLRKDSSLRRPEQRDRLLKLLDHPQLNGVDQALSHQAKVLYYRIYTFYYYTIGDFDSFYKTGVLLLDIMEAAPHFLKESVTNYISALSNLLVGCILSFDYDQAEVYLKKLKAIKPISADDKLKIHRQYYTVKFRLCINTGAFEEGLKALEEHLTLLASGNVNSKIFETESFYFQYICIYFGTGVYDKALDYLNRWLNSPKSIERQDLQSFARMINLIIHYEMGNHLLLDSLLRSTYRFLNNRNSLYQMEARMITFIRDVNHAQDRKTRETVLYGFKRELINQMEDKKVKAMLQLFDLEAWLDSKILNMSFAEVVERKFLQEKQKVKFTNHTN